MTSRQNEEKPGRLNLSFDLSPALEPATLHLEPWVKETLRVLAAERKQSWNKLAAEILRTIATQLRESNAHLFEKEPPPPRKKRSQRTEAKPQTTQRLRKK